MVTTRRVRAIVVEVEVLGPGLGRVDFEGDHIGAGIECGRFAMVEAPGRADCILLRPFSYFLAPPPDRVSLLVKDVGKGTHALMTAAVGDPVTLLGPLGNAFPVPTGTCWCVAGGVGAAPFGVIARHPDTRILLGARTAVESGFAGALRAAGGKVSLATDDGTEGFSGSVVDLLRADLQRERPVVIYACGPMPMMAAVADVAASHGIECWASLEERMGCGFGVCRGCAHVDASGGWRCICEDGPVYEATTIFPAPDSA